MYYNNKRNLLERFLSGNDGDTYAQKRLTTRSDDGTTELIAYTWLKLAEYDPDQDTVTVFMGHKSINSTTVSRYLSDVIERANDMSRKVSMSGESPTVDTPNDGTKYINNYVSMSGSHSAVEQDAIDDVVDSMKDDDDE